MSNRTYARILLLFGSQRLLELVYSRRNERRIAAREPDAPEAGASIFRLIAALNLALFTVPALERRLRRRPPLPAVAVIGWAAALTGVALRLSVLATLRDEWNVRAIVPRDVHIVDRGPYRFIRHPNYLALGLEFLGLPLIGGAYLSALVLGVANALLLSRRIEEEDRMLMTIPRYRAMMGGKPMIVPRIAQRPVKILTHSRGVIRLNPQ